ncbi:RagB/SusD family nutrient uptake outer membrane protein [Pedobacter duraquae]|uniref:SusD-like starch-binding protein associating with outer membrane n=1 Tax=Pedobacter duraquae TaxID=425511 RepID=A0A4R6IQS4_9SPHI|nr:RagB/SusD family nutrient uptake outer membrane protein [Pedobacter duraquae]TDO24551.1 SusD-like starch-binding protein associating with outer membrane [Pedobacter duraquae]
MKRQYLILLGVALAIIATGCRKYVEIEQPNQRTLKYTTDYRYTMNNNSVLEGTFSYPILSGDDTEITDPTRQNTLGDILGNVYTWAAKYTSETQGDADWEKLYKTIYTCNEVIAGVRSSLGGTTAEKEKIYAEALVHRAYAYLILVNMYGKQYTDATATIDPAVPLLTTPNLYTSLKRASVSEVYTQIVKDLSESVSRLPALPDYNVRPAKVSAYAILARTYLNMRDFNKASVYADSALTLQNTLLDLKTFAAAPGTVPVRLKDPEIMLSKLSGVTYTAISVSNDLLTAMGVNDLRYRIFTNTRSAFGGGFSAAFTGRANSRYLLNGEFSIVNGPSVPEMMLTKAECLARAGNTAGALTLVNDLRKKRFTDANYVALTANSADEALKIVVDEKRKELFGTGLRWFDQKRLNLDQSFAVSKTRVFKETSYTLSPNSNRYLYPIGDKYILLNPELAQNPR